MKQENYTTRVLVAEDGFYLTQSSEVEISGRIITKKVFLGINDSPENWKEITAEEAENIRKEQEEETQKIIDNHE